MNNLQEIYNNTFQYFHSLYEIVTENINQSLIFNLTESISESLSNESINQSLSILYNDNSKNPKNNLETIKEVEIGIIDKIEGEDL